MIAIQTPTGKKGLIPRGYMNATGAKKGFARVAMRTTTGSIDIWTPAETGNPLTLDVNPPAGIGYGAGPYAVAVTTGLVTASAIGAVGAVTWSWAFDSGDPGITISAPTSAATEFYASVEAGATLVADFIVTATDSIGRSANQAVTVNLTNYLWGGY